MTWMQCWIPALERCINTHMHHLECVHGYICTWLVSDCVSLCALFGLWLYLQVELLTIYPRSIFFLVNMMMYTHNSCVCTVRYMYLNSYAGGSVCICTYLLVFVGILWACTMHNRPSLWYKHLYVYTQTPFYDVSTYMYIHTHSRVLTAHQGTQYTIDHFYDANTHMYTHKHHLYDVNTYMRAHKHSRVLTTYQHKPHTIDHPYDRSRRNTWRNQPKFVKTASILARPPRYLS